MLGMERAGSWEAFHPFTSFERVNERAQELRWWEDCEIFSYPLLGETS